MIRLLTCLLLLLWTAPAWGQAIVAHVPDQCQQAYAETVASKWWSEHYRDAKGRGAAWFDRADPERGQYYVGVCDGRAARPGIVRGTEIGPDGKEINASYAAEHPSPTGGYYKTAHWFGYGDTWEDAFHDALRRGFAPGPAVKLNDEEARFLRHITTRRNP